MIQKFDSVHYDAPTLYVVAVAIEAGFSLSDSSLENIGEEREDMEW